MENKTELLEEIKVTIIAPYNMPLKHFFNSDNFEIKIVKDNGSDPIVIIRHKPNE